MVNKLRGKTKAAPAPSSSSTELSWTPPSRAKGIRPPPRPPSPLPAHSSAPGPAAPGSPSTGRQGDKARATAPHPLSTAGPRPTTSRPSAAATGLRSRRGGGMARWGWGKNRAGARPTRWLSTAARRAPGRGAERQGRALTCCWNWMTPCTGPSPFITHTAFSVAIFPRRPESGTPPATRVRGLGVGPSRGPYIGRPVRAAANRGALAGLLAQLLRGVRPIEGAEARQRAGARQSAAAASQPTGRASRRLAVGRVV